MRKQSMLGITLATLLVTATAGAGINAVHEPRAEEPVPLRFVLNVPAHRLYVYEQGEHTKTYRVSVGMRGNQTPAGNYSIRSLIWNPWWHPPNSEWARGRKPEPPAANNPMGRVKLHFAPLLYIHGTVERSLLGDPASRGCVRMTNDDLIELTRMVHAYLTPKIGEETLAELEGNEKLTRTYNLPRSIPFEVNYNVASVIDGFLLIYPDIYQRVKDYEKTVTATLLAEGVDLERVNWDRLEPLLEKGRKTKVAISIDELLAVTPVQEGGASH